MNIQKFGKSTTIFEGTQEELDKLRSSLHSLGIPVQDSLFIELRQFSRSVETYREKYKITSEGSGSIMLKLGPEDVKKVESTLTDGSEIKLNDGKQKNPKELIFLRNGDSLTVHTPENVEMLASDIIKTTVQILKLEN